MVFKTSPTFLKSRCSISIKVDAYTSPRKSFTVKLVDDDLESAQVGIFEKHVASRIISSRKNTKIRDRCSNLVCSRLRYYLTGIVIRSCSYSTRDKFHIATIVGLTQADFL